MARNYANGVKHHSLGSRSAPWVCIAWLLACLLTTISFQPAHGQTIDDANRLLLTGRYAEAAEQFAALQDKHPTAATLGLARCHTATGEYEKADEQLKAAVAKNPDAAPLLAELAQLAFDSGKYEKSQQHVDAALKANPKQVRARWLTAELHRVHGRLDQAEKAYHGLVTFYNEADAADVSDPEDIHLIGQAAAQYARWKRNSKQFSFLVNSLYPSALKAETNYWPARLATGRLFSEKYNQRDATAELNAALAINPNSAEIHAARAELALQSFDLARAATSIEQALEINPKLLLAHQLKADHLLINFRTAEAIEALEAARKLNPRSEATLGRLAAAYGHVDGFDDDSGQTRLGEVIAEATEFNPAAGGFFEAAGDALDLLRKYPHAGKYYAEAKARMSQLIGVPGKLGMIQMRLGDEAAARKLLEESFDADPFNVRVKNSLAVLDVLAGYAEIETEHFILRFDRGRDGILAQQAANYLEENVYPDLVAKLGYEPEGKTLLEFFSRAKNTSGHGWFSARMVGLPYIGTVGACAGKMVAMASPNDMDEKYNWARVLRHEFVHVVNLQQTDFNIPHWYTEALAVWNEGYPRPPDWTQLLARRAAADDLFDLDDINFGFMRPGSGDDWTLAYCQAELYAEYMVARFGDDALAKMLAAYADNLDTPAAIQRSFDVDQEDFEQGYLEHIKGVVRKAHLFTPNRSRSLTVLETALRKKPQDAELLAELAYAYLKRKSNTQARHYALAALKQDNQQQLAAYVLARQYLSIGDFTTAKKLLQNKLDRAAPQEDALALLAAIRIREKDFESAEELYQLGQTKIPHPNRWLKALAGLHIKSGDDTALASVLEKLVAVDVDNLSFRVKLMELAQQRRDTEAAGRWGREIIYIDVMNAEAHAAVATHAANSAMPSAAAEGYAVALGIDGSRNDWRMAKAKAEIAADDRDGARRTLRELLDRSPGHDDASKLLKEITE